MAKVTIREAARLVGRDRTTLYRYVQDGTLAMTVDHRGKERVRVIDTAELERVFGPLREPAQQSQPAAKQTAATPDPPAGYAVAVNSLQQQVQLLQQELERSREREDDLRRRLDASEDERRQAQRQLADLRAPPEPPRRRWWWRR